MEEHNMNRLLATSAMLLGLLAPAMAGNPKESEPQINTYPEGFFYSSERSYLGVDVRDINSELVNSLKLKEERGVEITMVDQDAPAGKAGLKAHDVILEYNGTKVESDQQFRRMIRETPPGRSITLGISRDGNPMTINVKIGDRSKLANEFFKSDRHGHPMIVEPSISMPDLNLPFDIQVLSYNSALGIQAENLSQQLGEYFGAKDGEGILVKSVEKGSAAEKAGMKAGDVIVRADNEKVSERTDLRRVLLSHRNGGKVTLGIIRDKHEQTLTIDLPPRGSDSSRLVIPDLGSFDAMKSELQEHSVEISREVADNLRRLKPELEQAQKQAQDTVKRITPQLQQEMRRIQKDMRQWSEEMKKAAQEWRGNNLI
jgi:serine protease Do